MMAYRASCDDCAWGETVDTLQDASDAAEDHERSEVGHDVSIESVVADGGWTGRDRSPDPKSPIVAGTRAARVDELRGRLRAVRGRPVSRGDVVDAGLDVLEAKLNGNEAGRSDDPKVATDGGVETAPEGDNWELASAIIRSKYRRLVVEKLQEGPSTPAKISKAIGVEIAHTSRALNGLREYDIVELLVPEETKKGRIYGLTDEGERAAAAVQEAGLDE